VDEVEKKTAESKEFEALLTQSYDDTLEALGSALELKDAETVDHSRRVTAYTISIAKNVSIPLPYLTVLARAAFLHDRQDGDPRQNTPKARPSRQLGKADNAHSL
jgi:HD-GYP domain-containing protein (c-di-GMP phosphodiesterase class II)